MNQKQAADNPLRLEERETGRVVVARVERAETAWKRTVGLLGRVPLAPEEGLWLEPCNGIHTCGMKYVLDVVFLDRNGQCMRVAENVAPWRFCGPVRRARVVVELPAGTIARCRIQPGKHYVLHSLMGKITVSKTDRK